MEKREEATDPSPLPPGQLAAYEDMKDWGFLLVYVTFAGGQVISPDTDTLTCRLCSKVSLKTISLEFMTHSTSTQTRWLFASQASSHMMELRNGGPGAVIIRTNGRISASVPQGSAFHVTQQNRDMKARKT